MSGRTFIRGAGRRLAAAAALAAFLGTGTATAAAANDTPRHVVRDPHFGESLYYFFQDRYFSSITTLMTAQHFGRLPHHADEAEVLRGGMLLSYGLHREAGEIFTHLIENGAAPPVRDRAWFYLAKIRYQRGELAQAEDALIRVENHLPTDLEEERRMLQAYLLMARADYAAAANVLKDMLRVSDAALYARYNLGVALIKAGEATRGRGFLEEVGQAPAQTEEYRSLRDKANLALGYSALQDNAPMRARTSLERVRLDGMLTNRALLGLGWAEAASKHPREALVPWSELAKRDPSDAAVLEAKLAVPYALGQLGAYGQSLDQYNDAMTVFDRENISLDESIAAIRAGKLLAGLLARNPGEEMGWFWNIDQLPEMPHAGHLVQVLAQHDFQEAFKNYRDLQFLAGNLREWEKNLGIFDDMLANRRLAYAERLPGVRMKQNSIAIADLEHRRDELAAQLARVEAETDVAAFADAKERELGARLDRVRTTLDRATADPDAAAARERYRRTAGALSWQLAQAFPARLWDARKALSVVDVQLAEARRRGAALAQAQRDEPAHFDQFAARNVELVKRVKALIPRVAELDQSQQRYVQELAVAELERQKDRLATYATQARFAVAQIYDHASRARDADHATAK